MMAAHKRRRVLLWGAAPRASKLGPCAYLSAVAVIIWFSTRALTNVATPSEIGWAVPLRGSKITTTTTSPTLTKDFDCPKAPPQLPELAKLGIDTNALCHCIPPAMALSQNTENDLHVTDRYLARLRHSISVSAIIPFYEQTEFLTASVQSLLKQTVELREVVIVDDGSPSSPDLTRAFQEAISLDPRRVRVIHQSHQGLPAARNLGIQNSTADFLFFIDPDDMAEARAIELLAGAIQLHGADFAWGDILFFGDLNLIWRTQEFNPYDLLWSNHPASQALVSRVALERYGMYNVALRDGMEDWAMWARMAALGATGKRVPLATFQYRRHGRAMTNAVNARKQAITRQVIAANAFMYAPEHVHKVKLQHRPLLSVIMPFHNTNPDWATQALQSLGVQTLSDFEVVVVDDGSTDERAMVWLEQQQQDSANWTFPLRIIHQTQSGPASARNTGVRAARGDMISFLDPDDLLTPTSLEKLAMKLIIANETVAYAYGAVKHFGSIKGTSRDEFDARRLLRENYLAIFGVMWKAVYMRIGGMDAAFDGHEDYDLWLRALQFGYRGAYVDEVFLEYRRHSEGRTGFIHRRSSFEAEHRKLRDRNPLLYGKPCTAQDQYAPMHDEPEQSALQHGFKHKVSMLQGDMMHNSSLEQQSYRRAPHPLPFKPDRYGHRSKPAIIYLVPFMAVGGSEAVDLAIIQGLAPAYHVTLVVESQDKNQWEDRFKNAADEVFVLSRLAFSKSQYPAIIDYLIVTRNACLFFNRNSMYAYEMSPVLRHKYPELRQVDLIHLYEESYGAWERFSVPYHARYHMRYVISEDLRQYMNTKYNFKASDFTVVRNGIDMRSYSALARNQAQIAELDADATRQLVVGFAGRLEEQKRPLRFVRVAKALTKLATNVSFVMIGQGPLKLEVEAEATRNHLNIEYIKTPKPEVLARLSILLSTSSFEGVPLVIIEAGAAGVMAVAPDVGGVREAVIPLQGEIYPRNEAEDDVAARVLSAWKNETPERRARRRKTSFELFDEARMQREYLVSLNKLLATQNASKAHEDFVYRLIDRPLLE